MHHLRRNRIILGSELSAPYFNDYFCAPGLKNKEKSLSGAGVMAGDMMVLFHLLTAC